MSVEPEKSVTAEIGHVASEFLLLDLPYGGDLFGMKLRDVEQTEDMQSFVVHEDATRNGESDIRATSATMNEKNQAER